MLIYILAASAFFALPMNLADNTPVVKEKPITAAPVENKKFPLESKDVLAAMLWPLGILTGCPGSSTDPEPVNQNPTANAGTNFEHNITTSGTTVTLSGSGTDSDGSVASYVWACTSKPAGAADPSFSDSTAAGPTVSGFNKLGEYKFTLKVTDNEGAESVGSTVTVSLCKTATTLDILANSLSPAPVTELDFIPIYNNVSNAADFTTTDINNCLTYTVTAKYKGNTIGSWNNTTPGFSGNVPLDSSYEVNDELIVFTQTFYNDGQEKGSRFVEAVKTLGVNEFVFGMSLNNTGSVPAVLNVSINRKVTEGNM